MDNIIPRKEARSQGLKHYFTGKPCKHGHLSARNTKSGRCLECDRVKNKLFRDERPEVMNEWRRKNPTYASDKYHQNKEQRKRQSREWYLKNREYVLDKHKKWYYDSRNQDTIQRNRKQWYSDNPDYYMQYYYDNHEHFLTNLIPKQRQRYYDKRRKHLIEEFQRIAINYHLPDSPNEHDFKYWMAGEIIRRTGWIVLKEVFLDTDLTSRIDLLIPDQKIGIELKMNNMYGNSIATEEQVKRYREHLPDYTILLVSLDGSIGINPDDLFVLLDC